MKPQDVINLDLYPIDGPLTRIVDDYKAQLDRQQYVVLPDFIRPEAREFAIRQVEQALPSSNHNASARNCYLQRKGDPSLPADHPRNVLLRASTWMLAADLLPDDSPLKTLYYWDAMRNFVAGIVGADTLYFNEDPLQPVNALCYRDGDQSAWHFDSVNAFTMTLMLQAPKAGGRFEIIPNIRSDDDQKVDRVQRAVHDEDDGAVEVGRTEGALCIFRGCNSLHRVSKVEGDRLRIMGVFVYENEPGVIGDPEVNATVYGRSAPTAA